MVIGKFREFAVVLAVVGLLGMATGSVVTAAQPSYDTLRVDNDGVSLPYQVSVDSPPAVVATPDAGAWAFFSAQAKRGDNAFGSLKLYAARFDPKAGIWQAAVPLKGGAIQYGPSAVVDGKGTVHLVLSDQPDANKGTVGTIVYMKSTPDGGWTDPAPIAANPNAGSQLNADLAIDGNGGLHVAWQDQRGVDAPTRDAAPTNADVFASDLQANGTWSAPSQMNVRPDATTNGSRPKLAVDGDRLVAVWSVYDQKNGLATASRLEWGTRGLSDPSGKWSAPQVLLERGNSLIGGRLLDLAADPMGGVAIVFGRRENNQNTLFLQRLAKGAPAWSAPLPLFSGDRGSFPAMKIAGDGAVYIAYQIGSTGQVHVGAVGLAPAQSRVGVEMTLTAGEEGSQGRPGLGIDGNGRVWVIYFHEPAGAAVKANEVRVLRGATIPSAPAPEATPGASPVTAATPAA